MVGRVHTLSTAEEENPYSNTELGLSNKTIMVAIAGPENVGKSILACGACERVLYVGKMTHMHTIERTLGYRLVHVEEFMWDYFEMIRKSEEANGNKAWQPPSINGYHLDACLAIVKELKTPERRAKLIELFDSIVFDECTFMLDQTFNRWNKEAEWFVDNKKNRVAKFSRNPQQLMHWAKATHRFVSAEKDDKPCAVNTQSMYLAAMNEAPYMFSQAETLGINVFAVFHVREAEKDHGLGLRGISRKTEKNLTELFQELYLMDLDQNRFIDGFSNSGSVFAPYLYADQNDKETRTKAKEGIVQGHTYADLWAVLRMMGVKTRRQEGREKLDADVLEIKNHFLKEKITEPRAQAQYVWAFYGQGELPFTTTANRIQAVRNVYRQAAALAWYEARQAEKMADPFASPLPGSRDAVTQSSSGGGSAPANFTTAAW